MIHNATPLVASEKHTGHYSSTNPMAIALSKSSASLPIDKENHERMLTQAKTHPALIKLPCPSSPRYLVNTVAPNENPTPKIGASGYSVLIYNNALRRSSAEPDESCGVRNGTFPPKDKMNPNSFFSQGEKRKHTATGIDNDAAISKAAF